MSLAPGLLTQHRGREHSTTQPEGNHMSASPHDTPRDVTIPLTEPPRGFITTADYLLNVNKVRAYETVSGLVSLSIGSTQVVLSPTEWAVAITALQQVLPVQGQQLTGYTACEGITAVNA